MKIVTLALVILSVLVARAQTTLSGTIADEKGESIPGANISIVGTYDGASSSMNGSFSFQTLEQGDQILTVSFVGYKTYQQQVQLVGTDIELHIKLREEINQLEAVVISAGSFTAGEEKRRTILKAVDIATTAGATADIAGALNTLPGTQKVGESGRLFVRGGDGSETRTFIDGMMVLDAYSPAAPNTPSRGRFLPFMFKGTSFSTGGYSSEYGQALSSALVLNSKDKAELNQTDFGLLSVGGDIAHTHVWDQASLSGKIQYTNIRPYFGLINQQIDWIKPPVSIESSSAFRQKIGESGIVKFFGNYNYSNYSLYQHDILNPSQKTAYDLTNNYRYGNASFLQGINEKWLLRGGLSFNRNGNDIAINEQPFHEAETGVHSKVVAENNISDRLEFRFGVENMLVNYKASQQDSFGAPQTIRLTNPITASFQEVEAYANNKLVAKAGLRQEFNHDLQKLSIDPRMSVAYKPFDKGQFSLAYGRFRQLPIRNLLRTNPSLHEELAEHYIVNYQVVNDQRTFRAELYYKRYSSLVKYVNGDASQLTNDGKGYAKGFELFWRDSKSIRNVDYWISYSYLDTERDYLNFPVAAIPTFASSHNFSVVYKHFITQIRSQVGMTYSYSSPRAFNNPNSEKFNAGRTPSYQDLSANVSYLPKPYLIIYASVTNLLGRDNIFGYEYSRTPDTNGMYGERAVRQAAKRFIFLGVFITISKNKSINQLPNL